MTHCSDKWSTKSKLSISDISWRLGAGDDRNWESRKRGLEVDRWFVPVAVKLAVGFRGASILIRASDYRSFST